MYVTHVRARRQQFYGITHPHAQRDRLLHVGAAAHHAARRHGHLPDRAARAHPGRSFSPRRTTARATSHRSRRSASRSRRRSAQATSSASQQPSRSAAPARFSGCGSRRSSAWRRNIPRACSPSNTALSMKRAKLPAARCSTSRTAWARSGSRLRHSSRSPASASRTSVSARSRRSTPSSTAWSCRSASRKSRRTPS